MSKSRLTDLAYPHHLLACRWLTPTSPDSPLHPHYPVWPKSKSNPLRLRVIMDLCLGNTLLVMTLSWWWHNSDDDKLLMLTPATLVSVLAPWLVTQEVGLGRPEGFPQSSIPTHHPHHFSRHRHLHRHQPHKYHHWHNHQRYPDSYKLWYLSIISSTTDRWQTKTKFVLHFSIPAENYVLIAMRRMRTVMRIPSL